MTSMKMYSFPWSKREKAPQAVAEKCGIVAERAPSDGGVALGIVFDDDPGDRSREIVRHELPSEKATAHKCKCGEPFRLGEKIARLGSEVHIQTILFILPGDVLRLSPAKPDWVRDVWQPGYDPMMHASHVADRDLARIKEAETRTLRARKDYADAVAALFGERT